MVHRGDPPRRGGYLLFHQGQRLAWDSGLPAGADLAAIVRSAVLGAVWSGVTGRLAFLAEALYFAAEEATAGRVASAFHFPGRATTPASRAGGARSSPTRSCA
jgi:hypothetical protein